MKYESQSLGYLTNLGENIVDIAIILASDFPIHVSISMRKRTHSSLDIWRGNAHGNWMTANINRPLMDTPACLHSATVRMRPPPRKGYRCCAGLDQDCPADSLRIRKLPRIAPQLTQILNKIEHPT
jgi:hypothetical protein